MTDEEWTEIKRVTGAEHGKLVGAIEDRMLVPTGYSPPMFYSSQVEAKPSLAEHRSSCCP